METNPTISVVVPVYKVELYVEQSIRSVLKQTFKDFELIAVDDASPDRSIELVKRLAQEDDRIKIIRHEINQGLGPARNTGLEHARGKYVYFLDSDDLIVPNALEIMHRAAEANDADVVHCSNFMERMELKPGKFDPKFKRNGDNVPVKGMLYTDRNKRLIERYIKFGEWMMVWLNFYRRDFLERHQLKNPSMLSEDNPFSIALHCLADRYYCIDDALYIYTRRGSSITKFQSREHSIKWIASVAEGIKYIDEVMNRLPEDVLSRGNRSWCIGAFMVGLLNRTLFKFYSLETIRNTDSMELIDAAMQPYFGENSRIASSFLQNYAVQKLLAQKKTDELNVAKKKALVRDKKIKTLTAENNRLVDELPRMTRIWERLKNSSERVILLSVPLHSNLGDHAITLGERALLRTLLPEREIIEVPTNYLFGALAQPFDKLNWAQTIRADDVLFIQGGGNVGTLWPNEEQVHKNIIRQFPSNRIVIMPQSIFFDEVNQQQLTRESVELYNAHNDLHLLCRDENSFATASKLFPKINRYLTPDSVTALFDALDRKSEPREGVLFILRADKEKLDHSALINQFQAALKARGIPFSIADMIADKPIDETTREAAVNALIEKIRRSRLVITDRFHGTILSTLTRTPVIAMKSFDTKISSGIKWFSDLDYVLYAGEADQATIDRFIEKYLARPSSDDNAIDGAKFKRTLLEALNKIVAPRRSNRIKISVETSGNRINYVYEVIGEWKKYFRLENNFFVEYGEDVSSTPPSVAIIPMLCNVLPMAWVLDAEIIIDELDKDFFERIDEIKRGYIEMMPRLKFAGELTFGRLVDNSCEPSGRSLLLFSGGVDAFSSLITHAEEHPTLMTIHGSDISLDDEIGWAKVEKHVREVGSEFDCETLFIKSSFRLFLNEGALTRLIKPFVFDGWWHDLQHGIGLLSHAAPYAFKHRLKTIYIGSSYTASDRGKVSCASDPTIDNHFAVASCRTVHDGYEFLRQDKIGRICEYQKRTGRAIRLRVCWRSKGGENCCRCGKCWRAILGLYAEHVDPQQFGFNYGDWDKFLKLLLNNQKEFELRRQERYEPIVKSMHKNYRREEISPDLLWLYDMKF